MKKYEISRVVLLVENFKSCAVVAISIASQWSVAIAKLALQEINMPCITPNVYCERFKRRLST